ncbi:MAG: protein-L-isoaspartate O-methyltransferase family protein [Mycobacteriaceae bacterium]|uniref:protein-L-isoaspartate O-methyltransferase family protein n=1 Tax=Corynebacterium sp. TaxID=1720 RepID=UPI003F9EA47C
MDHTVRSAMSAVPREHFLPGPQKGNAGFDGALPIGGGSTCSQPSTVRDMLELLGAGPGDRVLDVGSGSGWTTAILSRLVGADGEVTGTEILPEMVERSRTALAEVGVENCGILQADGSVLGNPSGAPYDRILFSADAGRGVPQVLVGQLADGGVMVGPVGGVMTRVVKEGDAVRTTEHGLYRFVPLIEG